jgi:hypothetical protein
VSERTVTVKLRQRRISTGAYSACYVRAGLKSPPLSVARREEDGVNGAAANRQCLYSADPTRVPKRISGILKKKKFIINNGKAEFGKYLRPAFSILSRSTSADYFFLCKSENPN